MTKALGTALYTEFRRDGYTTQMILVSEVIDPTTGTLIPFTLLSRQVSEDNPRRTWKAKKMEAANSPITVIPGTPAAIQQVATIPEAVAVAVKNYNMIDRAMQSMATGNWNLVLTPVTVELSSDDTKDLVAGDTPQALIRRMTRARSEAGFPDQLWGALAPTTAATV